MLRRLLLMVGLLIAGLLFTGAPAFGGAPPVTETTTQKNLVETFVDVIPDPICSDEGPLYTITTTTNLVMHSTIFADGREHDTFTQTGTFVAVPQDPSLPTYTGHFTMWGGFNGNAQSASGTFTFSLHGTANDGSTITLNSVEHFNVTPGGVENSFSFENCH